MAVPCGLPPSAATFPPRVHAAALAAAPPPAADRPPAAPARPPSIVPTLSSQWEITKSPSRQHHITRPLEPPYSLHTVLLKVEAYLRGGSAEAESARASAKSPRASACKVKSTGLAQKLQVGPRF